MDEILTDKIKIKEFEKKPDGSWVSVTNIDFNTKFGRVIRVGPGITFKKGATFWGFDVAKVLDELTAN